MNKYEFLTDYLSGSFIITGISKISLDNYNLNKSYPLGFNIYHLSLYI
jgi:hypothetical protein